MKKVFTLFIILGLGFQSYSQLKPKAHDWFFYDLTYLHYLNAPDGTQQNWYSNGHNLSLLKGWMFGENFGLAAGLGFNSQNFYNNMRISTVERSGKETYTLISDTAFSSNEQTMQYLNIPVEIRFRTKTNDKGRFFRLYLGARFGVRINAYADFEGENIHERYYSLNDLNRFKADAYLRIGYGFFGLYASYGLTQIYQEGQSVRSTPDGIEITELNAIRPLAVGISFSL